nr:ribonuclease H-like domain-containing protein [Tanacetum cinerariifolium]
MAFSDKYQLKFNIHKDAKSLMEAIEKRFGGRRQLEFLEKPAIRVENSHFDLEKKADLEEQSLDDFLNNLKIYEVEQIDPDDLEEMDLKWQMAILTMRARRFLKRTRRNLGANGTDTIGFDMSKVKCYNCHRRGHIAKECRSPRDNRNKETTRRTVPTEVSTSNALVSQYDAVGGYDWSFQADEEPTNYALMAYTSSGSSSSSGSDNEVAPCSKAYSKAYATLQTHYDNLTIEFKKSQLDVLSYKTGLESVEARLVVYQNNETVFEEDIKFLKLDVMLRDNALAELRKKFEKADKERNDLKLTLDKFQTSFKNLKLHSHESNNRVPKNLENDRYQTVKGYHAVPPSYTGTFLPLKPDLVFTDNPNASESLANVINVDSSKHKPIKDMSKTHRPDAPIIEEWISDSEDETEIESVPKQREPSFVKSTEHVKYFREIVMKVEHHKQAVNLRTNNHKSRVRMTHPHLNRNVVPTPVLTRSRLVSLNAARLVPTAVTQSTVKSTWPIKHVVNKAHSPGNPHQALKNKGVINSGCSRHMTRNISFLLEFKEIDEDYVAFRENPKGDTECVVLSFDYKLPDENHVLLRVPRENNMYNVDLKNVFPSGATKDETSEIFKTFITGIENQINHKVKIIRCDNGTEFKNQDLNQFYKMKGIKREFNIARTPQQNGVAKRKNITLIEPARTMLADSLLPIPFWAEAVNTASYVQNSVLVTKPHNKTLYELLLGRSPSLGFMRPFGCLITINNTLDPLGKFDGKADEGFLVGYSVNCKAFRVFKRIGPKWLFDIDILTMSMNYQPVIAKNKPNDNACIKNNLNAGKVGKETISAQQYVLLPLWSTGSQDPQNTDDDVADAAFDVKENENDVYVFANGSDKTDNKKHNEKAKRDYKGKSHVDSLTRVRDLRAEFEEFSFNSFNRVNAISAPVNAAGPNPTNNTNSFNIASPSVNVVSSNFGIARKSSFVDPSKYPDDPDMPKLKDNVYSDDEEDVGADADLSNLETNIPVSPIPTTRVYKDHHVNQIIGDLNSARQIRSMTRIVKEQGGLHQINDEDFHTCMFACFLSQEEPKKVLQALKDPSWIKSMQEELL